MVREVKLPNELEHYQASESIIFDGLEPDAIEEYGMQTLRLFD